MEKVISLKRYVKNLVFPDKLIDGRFTPLQTVGEGSFGVVKIAIDKENNNREVVLKYMKKEK